MVHWASVLLSPISDWPCELAYMVPMVTEELKQDSELVGHLVAKQRQLPSPVIADHQRFSRWLRLFRDTARIYMSVLRVFRSILHPNSKKSSS